MISLHRHGGRGMEVLGLRVLTWPWVGSPDLSMSQSPSLHPLPAEGWGVGVRSKPVLYVKS